MNRTLPDFKVRSLAHQQCLGVEGASRILDAGRRWDLAPVLRAGGTVIFPHATLDVCGHQIAAAVHACLDSGAPRVVVLGVLHARTPELEAARVHVAHGGDPALEEAWGIQGPGLPGRQDWQDEFSLLHFQFLWDVETKRRGIGGPELILRYPFLAGGQPERLPGIQELQDVAQNAVVVATMDPFHHGIGYGEVPENAKMPEQGGIELAHARIEEGLELLQGDDYAAFQEHCVKARSDGRDVGQVLQWLLGPLKGQILDLVADDMTHAYQQPPPTWVAGALIALEPAR